MKEITKMSRLSGQLEYMFRLLNKDFFDDKLPTPIITIIPTERAYAHYTLSNVWQCKDDEAKREINISSAYLDRPIEEICASMIHEMVHMNNDIILHVKDTSNNGVYHNKVFKREASSHGLIVTRSERYGWSHTEPSDELIEYILEHDEIREIELCRTVAEPVVPIGTSKTGRDSYIAPIRTTNNHHRKYVCPCCKNSCRATKKIKLICGDCLVAMVEA